MAVPVSLVGTFAFMQLAWLSLNGPNLYLVIVLAIGIGSDDAIVVVENVTKRNILLDGLITCLPPRNKKP